jgi:hypothetical protein
LAGLQWVISIWERKALFNFFPGSEKPLPREQRRGAIIVLGMLAVANRTVVSERVETLLKTGLGPFGKVCRSIRLWPLLIKT